MAWSEYVLLALFAIIPRGSSVRIEGCRDGRMAIVEGERTRITCSDISESNQVLWKYRAFNNYSGDVGQCNTNDECSTQTADVMLTRNGDRSSLFLLRNERRFGEVTVHCEQDNWILPNEHTYCTLTVTSRTKIDGCHAALDARSWSLKVSCFLYKMFTSFGYYGYALVLGKETLPGDKCLNSYTDEDSGMMYFSGTCTFIAPLPTEEGGYKYCIATSPPLSTPSQHDLIIKRPGDPNVSTCPTYVRETDNVTCLCDVSPTGNPPGIVWWVGQHPSSTLAIINVQRTDSDKGFDCRLSWGTYHKSASYTLRVAYGPDTAEISRSSFWVENDLTLVNLTCNATGYSPGVTYVWNVPCQSEVLVEHASVCSTSFKDQQADVTCTAANSQFPTFNATAITTIYYESGNQHTKNTGLAVAVIGGALAIIGIVSLCTGLAIYFKRRKAPEFSDHINEMYLTSSDVSSTELHNGNQFSKQDDCVHNKKQMRENHPRNSSSMPSTKNSSLESSQEENTCKDLYAVPDKSTKRNARSSQHQIHARSSAVTIQPASLHVQGNTQTEAQCYGQPLGSTSSQNISCSHYENLSTCLITQASSLRQNRSSEKSQSLAQNVEEIQPQLENDGALYNRLNFSRTIRLSDTLGKSAPVYDHFKDEY